MKLSELDFGEVFRDGEFDWLGLTAETYEGKKHLTFLVSEKYLDELNNNENVSCVILKEDLVSKVRKDIGIIISDNPKVDFFKLHNNLANGCFYKKKYNKNFISSNAKIASTSILKGTGIIIEELVEIEDFVVISSDVHIKKGVKIGAGSIIGSSPMEIYKDKEGNRPVLAIGKIIIDEYAQIQSNSTVEAGVFGVTYIGKKVQIDDLVQIGHDVKIQESTIITAGTIIGGRTRIGKNSYLGINSTIKNGLILGENVSVSMGAVVSKDVADNQTVTGNLAVEHSKFMENLKKMLK